MSLFGRTISVLSCFVALLQHFCFACKYQTLTLSSESEITFISSTATFPWFNTYFSLNLILDIELERNPNWFLLDHTSCGISSSNRIIGGRNASLGQYPWLARIGYASDNSQPFRPLFKCGGSLINQRYVLTAAHCVTELPGTFYVYVCTMCFKLVRIKRNNIWVLNETVYIFRSAVRLGEHNAITPIDCEDFMCASSPQDFQPEKLIVHKYYGNPSYKHDIALIRLDHPAALNRK